MLLGLFLFVAGISHFLNPDFFNDIVPPWLPPNESFWTYLSGIAEVAIGLTLLLSRSRRRGALAAIWLFVLVYPANLYMVWDWRHRPVSEQLVSWLRLPLQFLLIWWAWRVATSNRKEEPWPGSTFRTIEPD